MSGVFLTTVHRVFQYGCFSCCSLLLANGVLACGVCLECMLMMHDPQYLAEKTHKAALERIQLRSGPHDVKSMDALLEAVGGAIKFPLDGIYDIDRLIDELLKIRVKYLKDNDTALSAKILDDEVNDHLALKQIWRSFLPLRLSVVELAAKSLNYLVIDSVLQVGNLHKDVDNVVRTIENLVKKHQKKYKPTYGKSNKSAVKTKKNKVEYTFTKVCFDWNKSECSRSQCKYPHRCGWCNSEEHPAEKCTEKKEKTSKQ